MTNRYTDLSVSSIDDMDDFYEIEEEMEEFEKLNSGSNTPNTFKSTIREFSSFEAEMHSSAKSVVRMSTEGCEMIISSVPEGIFDGISDAFHLWGGEDLWEGEVTRSTEKYLMGQNQIRMANLAIGNYQEQFYNDIENGVGLGERVLEATMIQTEIIVGSIALVLTGGLLAGGAVLGVAGAETAAGFLTASSLSRTVAFTAVSAGFFNELGGIGTGRSDNKYVQGAAHCIQNVFGANGEEVEYYRTNANGEHVIGYEGTKDLRISGHVEDVLLFDGEATLVQRNYYNGGGEEIGRHAYSYSNYKELNPSVDLSQASKYSQKELFELSLQGGVVINNAERVIPVEVSSVVIDGENSHLTYSFMGNEVEEELKLSVSTYGNAEGYEISHYKTDNGEIVYSEAVEHQTPKASFSAASNVIGGMTFSIDEDADTHQAIFGTVMAGNAQLGLLERIDAMKRMNYIHNSLNALHTVSQINSTVISVIAAFDISEDDSGSIIDAVSVAMDVPLTSMKLAGADLQLRAADTMAYVSVAMSVFMAASVGLFAAETAISKLGMIGEKALGGGVEALEAFASREGSKTSNFIKSMTHTLEEEEAMRIEHGLREITKKTEDGAVKNALDDEVNNFKSFENTVSKHGPLNDIFSKEGINSAKLFDQVLIDEAVGVERLGEEEIEEKIVHGLSAEYGENFFVENMTLRHEQLLDEETLEGLEGQASHLNLEDSINKDDLLRALFEKGNLASSSIFSMLASDEIVAAESAAIEKIEQEAAHSLERGLTNEAVQIGEKYGIEDVAEVNKRLGLEEAAEINSRLGLAELTGAWEKAAIDAGEIAAIEVGEKVAIEAGEKAAIEVGEKAAIEGEEAICWDSDGKPITEKEFNDRMLDAAYDSYIQNHAAEVEKILLEDAEGGIGSTLAEEGETGHGTGERKGSSLFTYTEEVTNNKISSPKTFSGLMADELIRGGKRIGTVMLTQGALSVISGNFEAQVINFIAREVEISEEMLFDSVYDGLIRQAENALFNVPILSGLFSGKTLAIVATSFSFGNISRAIEYNELRSVREVQKTMAYTFEKDNFAAVMNNIKEKMEKQGVTIDLRDVSNTGHVHVRTVDISSGYTNRSKTFVTSDLHDLEQKTTFVKQEIITSHIQEGIRSLQGKYEVSRAFFADESHIKQELVNDASLAEKLGFTIEEGKVLVNGVEVGGEKLYSQLIDGLNSGEYKHWHNSTDMNARSIERFLSSDGKFLEHIAMNEYASKRMGLLFDNEDVAYKKDDVIKNFYEGEIEKYKADPEAWKSNGSRVLSGMSADDVRLKTLNFIENDHGGISNLGTMKNHEKAETYYQDILSQKADKGNEFTTAYSKVTSENLRMASVNSTKNFWASLAVFTIFGSRDPITTDGRYALQTMRLAGHIHNSDVFSNILHSVNTGAPMSVLGVPLALMGHDYGKDWTADLVKDNFASIKDNVEFNSDYGFDAEFFKQGEEKGFGTDEFLELYENLNTEEGVSSFNSFNQKFGNVQEKDLSANQNNVKEDDIDDHNDKNQEN